MIVIKLMGALSHGFGRTQFEEADFLQIVEIGSGTSRRICQSGGTFFETLHQLELVALSGSGLQSAFPAKAGIQRASCTLPCRSGCSFNPEQASKLALDPGLRR